MKPLSELPDLSLLRSLLRDFGTKIQEMQELRSRLENKLGHDASYATFAKIKKVALRIGMILPKDTDAAKKRLDEVIRPSSSEKFTAMHSVAGPMATSAVHKTIDEVATFFGIPSSQYRHVLPSVVVMDTVTLADRMKYWFMDYGSYEAPVGTSFFTPRGNKAWNEPEGPVIQLIMNQADSETVVEESVHFLQWVAENPDLDRGLRNPNNYSGFFGAYEGNEQGVVLEEEIPGSFLFRGYFLPITEEDAFARGIYSEALAQATRNLTKVSNGYGTGEENGPSDGAMAQNADSTTVPSSFELGRTLVCDGFAAYRARILEEFNIEKIEDLGKLRPFSSMIGNGVFNELIHDSGYLLGHAVALSIDTDEKLKAFSDIAFTPRQRFDPPIDYVHKINELHEIVRTSVGARSNFSFVSR